MAATKIIYGTAWKKERTAALVVSAVLSGFRAIDTAGQPKHYREELVGEALEVLQKEHGIKREELFIQTKFTPPSGQDLTKPLPYTPSSPLQTQILTSFASSLSNLRTSYIDSYLLHSPLRTLKQTVEAWEVLVRLREEGRVGCVGVCNAYDVRVLEALEGVGLGVQVVQNRWFEGNGWDWEVVGWCKQHGVQYQSFWTLTGSPSLLSHPTIKSFARAKGCSTAQAVYRLAQLEGITPLSGTTSEKHMREDLEVESIEVDEESRKELGEVVEWMGLSD